MTKTKENETTKDKNPKQYTIVMKEKDKNGELLAIDVDEVIPSFILGESTPMMMGMVDDKTFFIPTQNINWFEQNYGSQTDREMAQKMVIEKRKQLTKKREDCSVV